MTSWAFAGSFMLGGALVLWMGLAHRIAENLSRKFGSPEFTTNSLPTVSVWLGFFSIGLGAGLFGVHSISGGSVNGLWAFVGGLAFASIFARIRDYAR
jgi:hypothetical protein